MQAFLGEKPNSNVGDIEAPFEGEALQLGAPHGHLGQPGVGEVQTLVEIELPQPRRRGERRRLEIAEGGAVGDVDGLQMGAAPDERLERVGSEGGAAGEVEAPDAARGGEDEGDGSAVEAGADGEVEGGEARENGEEGGEELRAEGAEVGAVEGVNEVEGLACGAEGFAIRGVGEEGQDF